MPSFANLFCVRSGIIHKKENSSGNAIAKGFAYPFQLSAEHVESSMEPVGASAQNTG